VLILLYLDIFILLLDTLSYLILLLVILLLAFLSIYSLLYVYIYINVIALRIKILKLLLLQIITLHHIFDANLMATMIVKLYIPKLMVQNLTKQP